MARSPMRSSAGAASVVWASACSRCLGISSPSTATRNAWCWMWTRTSSRTAPVSTPTTGPPSRTPPGGREWIAISVLGARLPLPKRPLLIGLAHRRIRLRQSLYEADRHRPVVTIAHDESAGEVEQFDDLAAGICLRHGQHFHGLRWM